MRLYLPILIITLLSPVFYSTESFGWTLFEDVEPQHLPTETVSIKTTETSHAFQIEIARTLSQRVKGLMYRKKLGKNRGMLFDYAQEITPQMWMKNTHIALDILFLDARGIIVDSISNTTPHSLTVLQSKHPAFAALELNAGSIKTFNIQLGDVVIHDIFKH